MKNNDQCRTFEAGLDAMAGGALDEHDRDVLLAHAAGCARCAELLRLRRDLAKRDLDALERLVPPDLVSGMWGKVAPSLRWYSTDEVRRQRWTRYAVPLLAAATVVVSCLSGYLALELRALQTRGLLLEGIVQRQERMIARASEIPRRPAAGLIGALTWGAMEWVPDREMSTGELISLLEGMPPDCTVASARQVRLLAYPGMLHRAAQGSAGQIVLDDGLQAGEIRAAMGALGLGPETLIDLRALRRRGERIEGWSAKRADQNRRGLT